MSRLAKEIEKYNENKKAKVPADILEIMDKATAILAKQNISAKALKVGAKLPSFELPNAQGITRSLESLLEGNEYLVINFYRGGWCPYCNLELNALQGIHDELKTLGTSLVAISPQTPDASLDTAEKNALAFEVLSDVGNVVSKDFGLVFSLEDELKPIYKQFGIDIPASNGDETYELPMPATYVVTKDAEVIYAYVDEDYTKRLEPSEILELLRAR